MNEYRRQLLAWALAVSTGIIVAMVLLHPRAKPVQHGHRAAQSAEDPLGDDSTPDLDAAPQVANLQPASGSAPAAQTRGRAHTAAAGHIAPANPIPVGHCKIPEADDPPTPLC